MYGRPQIVAPLLDDLMQSHNDLQKDIETIDEALTPKIKKVKQETQRVRTRTRGWMGFDEDSESVDMQYYEKMDEEGELQGMEGIKEYNKMSKSDIPNSIYQTYTKPIINARFYIEAPGRPDLEEYYNQNFSLNDMIGPVDYKTDILEPSLTKKKYGFALGERVYGKARNNWWYFDSLDIRTQTSIAAFNLSQGKLRSAYQIAPYGRGGEKFANRAMSKKSLTYMGRNALEIPSENMYIVVNEREGLNYWGRSIFRPIWKKWKYYEKLDALRYIAHKRIALPTLEAIPRIPIQADNNVGISENDVLEMSKQVLKIAKGNKDQITHEGLFTIKALELGGADLGVINETLEQLRKDMYVSSLVGFLLSGTENTGAYASVDSLTLTFYDIITATVDYLCNEFNRQILLPMVWADHGPNIKIRLRHSNINAAAATILADILRQAEGYVAPTGSIDNMLRNLTDSPELTQQEREKRYGTLKEPKFPDEDMNNKKMMSRDNATTVKKTTRTRPSQREAVERVKQTYLDI